MSLLMEALRKAEEAKSKAKKDESENSAGEDSLSASAEASSVESPPASAELQPAPDEVEELRLDAQSTHGPVIINPDPDEEETLASHFSETEQDSSDPSVSAKETDEEDPLSDLLDDLEKIEFITQTTKKENNPPETSSPPSAENKTGDEDDDGLSLLQSSYFTRTKKGGRSDFFDLEPEDFEFNSEPGPDEITRSNVSTQTGATVSTEIPAPTANTDNPDDSLTAAPAAHETEYAELAESLAETPPVKQNTTPQDNVNDDIPEAPPAAVTNPPARKAQSKQDKQQEKQKRDSANALFLAKQASQKRQTKKVRTIAAVLLVIPVAGISYWLYSSFNAPSGMQITMPPQSNQANRGEFLILDPPPAEEVATTVSVNDEAGPDSAPIQAIQAPAQSDSQTEQSVASTADTPAASDADGLTSLTQTPEQERVINQNSPAPSPASTAVADTNPPIAQQTAATEQPTQIPQQQIASQNNPAPASTPTLNFIRAEADDVLDPNLNAAYASYQQGDYEAAGRFYQLVLNNEPNNRDAMLGLASVYINQNNIAFSQNLYARLLELNPRDPLALAGLLDLGMRDDPAGQESELLSLTAAYPRVAPLSFALGNLYASQSRWSEAQNSYFNALLAAKSSNVGPISPDYAYNLAVSLERVNQLRAALDYYREAEELSRFAAPGFNPQVLTQRLNYLEQRVP